MSTDGALTPEDFVGMYERALATQVWAVVEPLVHEDACVTFSTGTVHIGKSAVKRAFTENFSSITDEKYRISNVHWVLNGADTAIYLFDFDWTGQIAGKPAAGSGRGSSVLRHDNGKGWRLLIEHLGPRAS